MITQDQLDEAILSITGHRDWAIVAQFLTNEAIITRDSCADAESWDIVNKRSGFADGLAYVLNLRDMTEQSMEQRNANL